MRFDASLLLIMALVGCAGDRGTTADEITIRVENGVTIVENPGLHCRFAGLVDRYH
ncbi:MAG: hypothetical protein WEE89_22745 [Gemmatimonadota bacterium]